MLKENIDGEALLWAHGRLLQRSEARRILVVVSDGTPMDEGHDGGERSRVPRSHLQAVVRDIETGRRSSWPRLGSATTCRPSIKTRRESRGSSSSVRRSPPS
jgi:hypothetical protein